MKAFILVLVLLVGLDDRYRQLQCVQLLSDLFHPPTVDQFMQV